jgi:hypothetical protein
MGGWLGCEWLCCIHEALLTRSDCNSAILLHLWSRSDGLAGQSVVAIRASFLIIDLILQRENCGRYTAVRVNLKSRILPIAETHSACTVSGARLPRTTRRRQWAVSAAGLHTSWQSERIRPRLSIITFYYCLLLINRSSKYLIAARLCRVLGGLRVRILYDNEAIRPAGFGRRRTSIPIIFVVLAMLIRSEHHISNFEL